MTKSLRKEITVRSNTLSTMYDKNFMDGITFRSKMKNTCNKKRTHESLSGRKKQPNFFVKLLRKRKKDYFSDLNIKN